MYKDWKTTVAGMMAGIPIAANALLAAYEAGTFTGETGAKLIVGIAIVLLGAYSADKKPSVINQ